MVWTNNITESNGNDWDPDAYTATRGGGVEWWIGLEARSGDDNAICVARFDHVKIIPFDPADY